MRPAEPPPPPTARATRAAAVSRDPGAPRPFPPPPPPAAEPRGGLSSRRASPPVDPSQPSRRSRVRVENQNEAPRARRGRCGGATDKEKIKRRARNTAGGPTRLRGGNRGNARARARALPWAGGGQHARATGLHRQNNRPHTCPGAREGARARRLCLPHQKKAPADLAAVPALRPSPSRNASPRFQTPPPSRRWARGERLFPSERRRRSPGPADGPSAELSSPRRTVRPCAAPPGSEGSQALAAPRASRRPRPVPRRGRAGDLRRGPGWGRGRPRAARETHDGGATTTGQKGGVP